MWVPHFNFPRNCEYWRVLLYDAFKRGPLRLHANVAVMPEHLLRDVSGDVHDGLGVPVIVPAALNPGFFAQVAPCGFQGSHGPRGIVRVGLAEWKNVPVWSQFAESELIPVRV